MAFTKEQEREYLNAMYKKAGLSNAYTPKPKPEPTGFVEVTYVDKFEVKKIKL